MSFTYSTLKTAIGDYLESAETTFTTHLPTFVTESEDRIFRLVELPEQRKNGQPKYYSIYSQDSFALAPIPDAAYTVELHYLYKPSSLTSGSDSGTTVLSTDYPDALLYGSLVEGAIFLKEPPDVIAQFEARFKEAIMRMKNLSEGRDTRDEYRHDSLRTGVS